MKLRKPGTFRNGVKLRYRLLGLILVPIVGGVLVAAVQVDAAVGSARAARNADHLIRSMTSLVAAQSAFQQEIVPAFTATVLRNPALLGGLASSAAVPNLGGLAQQLAKLRATTDASIAALEVSAAMSKTLESELKTARSEIDQPTVLLDALSGASSFLSTISTSETAQLQTAAGTDIGAAGVRALNEIRITARATDAATSEITLLAATQFPGPETVDELRSKWIQGWQSFVVASAEVSQLDSAAAAQWDAVNAGPAVREFNELLAQQATSGAPQVSVAQLAQLVSEDGQRNGAYNTVLQSSLHRALATGQQQQGAAVRNLRLIVGAGLLLVLLSLAIAFVVGRSLTRPLGRLARQATRISEGELIDVEVSGPSEVRTVARALSGSVASLRNIEAHATAVAAGDLDSSAVQQLLPGPLGEVVHASVARIVNAMNERELAQRELAHRATHDALTELPNRAQALHLIGQALHRAQRSGGETALMFVDLDNFKSVNDTFGHAAGDQVLQSAARRMLHTVRQGETVARLGGDEFVVLLENIDDEADITRLATRLIETLSADMTTDGRVVRVGASIGLAFCRDGWVDADRLLQEADAATYRAKNAGRGRVDIFDDALRQELAERAQLEQAIAAGLNDGDFVLHYQPVVELTTGSTVGVEALIRWNRPGIGLVYPDDFIPIAERSNLINDLGRWVLMEATAQLARWTHQDPSSRTATMAVNISGTHLTSNQLLTDVADALARSGIDPTSLILEITETVLVDDDPVAVRNMQTLRELGIQISIDDFGTGFTSIGHLANLAVDTLKIDRSFVASPDPAQQTLVRLIASAAHAFGLTVVAEGIEEPAQAQRMKEADIEYGQGYLFSRPQPPQATFPHSSPTLTGGGSPLS